MSYKEKISKAKAKLLVNQPFLGTIAAKLKLIKNDDIEAFVSDGIQLEYNDDFINESSLQELEFIFANGAMHASMAYENRQNNRSNWLWQLSCDYAINDMLIQSGMQRPYQAHYSERFTNMYVEEIYAELKADIIRDAEELPENEGTDNAEQNESESSSEPKESCQKESTQIELDEQLFKEFASAVLENYEKKGELPQTLERFFTLHAQTKVDWRGELRNALDRFAKDDYVSMPPNKKFLSQGIYLPSLHSETFNLAIAIDSSASIDEILLEEFLSEVNSLMLSIPKYKIDLLVCDDKLRIHREFLSGESLDVELMGGGATDFRPVFAFVDAELYDTKLLLYFTDLDGTFPKDEPNFEVKWISKNILEIPFGEIIQI